MFLLIWRKSWSDTQTRRNGAYAFSAIGAVQFLPCGIAQAISWLNAAPLALSIDKISPIPAIGSIA